VKRTRTQALAVAACCGLFAAGCGDSANHDKYIPKEAAARKALEAALTSWQNGQKPGTIETDDVPIEVMDSKWRAGQKLASFQILQEEPGQGPRWFSVKLVMQKPAQEQTVRYVVLGNSPLWVYREEDFKKTSGMGM
jgi:hypothetical protein